MLGRYVNLFLPFGIFKKSVPDLLVIAKGNTLTFFLTLFFNILKDFGLGSNA